MIKYVVIAVLGMGVVAYSGTYHSHGGYAHSHIAGMLDHTH